MPYEGQRSYIANYMQFNQAYNACLHYIGVSVFGLRIRIASTLLIFKNQRSGCWKSWLNGIVKIKDEKQTNRKSGEELGK